MNRLGPKHIDRSAYASRPRRLFLSSVIAAASVIGLAVPSKAAVVEYTEYLGSFGYSSEENVELQARTFNAGDTFKGKYNFQLMTEASYQESYAGYTGSTRSASITWHDFTPSDSTGGKGLALFCASSCGPNYGADELVADATYNERKGVWEILAEGMSLDTGLYYLLASGTVAGGAVHLTGGMSLSFANPVPSVPLPGALLLMGSVLAGSAGFAGWRKRTKQALAA